MSTVVGHPHIKVTVGGLSFEHCEDPGCTVDDDGRASCGRVACPACGCGGAKFSLSPIATVHAIFVYSAQSRGAMIIQRATSIC